jgi:hypothetical protein
MKLPGIEHAVVPREKITQYLLLLSHPIAYGKAPWFHAQGFRVENWSVLANALKQHAIDHPVVNTEDSPFGKRYAIEGPLATPSGRHRTIRTVWFIENGGGVPRLVTAYPIAGDQLK